MFDRNNSTRLRTNINAGSLEICQPKTILQCSIFFSETRAWILKVSECQGLSDKRTRSNWFVGQGYGGYKGLDSLHCVEEPFAADLNSNICMELLNLTGGFDSTDFQFFEAFCWKSIQDVNPAPSRLYFNDPWPNTFDKIKWRDTAQIGYGYFT